MESARGLAQMRAIVAAGYRSLSKSCHPDAGGSHEAMLMLTQAREMLDEMLGDEGPVPPREARPQRPPRRRDDEVEAFEDVTVLAETEKAILCVIDDEEHWIPISQIHDDSEVYRMGTEGVLIITRWLAKKKGLI